MSAEPAKAESAKAEGEYPAVASPVGGEVLSRWTVAADSSLQTVSSSDPGASFGLGLTYQSTKTEITAIIRKGVADTVTEELGHFMLSPAIAKLGASFRVQVYSGSPKTCIVSGPDPEPLEAGQPRRLPCDRRDKTLTPNLLRFGVYWSMDAGTSNYDIQGYKGDVTAIAMTLGPAWRIEDKLGKPGAERPVALMAYFGGSFRASDLSRTRRLALLGDTANSQWGVELGAMARIATFDLWARISWLNGNLDNLSGTKFFPSVAFQLPFDVVAEPKGEQSTGDRKQPGGDNAENLPHKAAIETGPADPPTSPVIAAPTPDGAAGVGGRGEQHGATPPNPPVQ